MKINLQKLYTNYWHYNLQERYYTQEKFDYIFKYLDFDKLDKSWNILFNNKETKKLFRKIYIDEDWLKGIYNHSPKGYLYLKENWGKDIFRIAVCYPDKQELKTIVNKVINIKLIKE